MLDLDTLFVWTAKNLGGRYGSWHVAEIQITQVRASEVHFEQCRLDDTWLFVKRFPNITRSALAKAF